MPSRGRTFVPLRISLQGATFRIEWLAKAERVRSRPVSLKVLQARHRLSDRGAVSGRDPPQGNVRIWKGLEPLAALSHDAGVVAAEYK